MRGNNLRILYQSFLILLLYLTPYLFATQAPILLVIGTRPEGIKMAPVYHELKKREIPCVVCSTGQHSDLLDEVLDLFDIVPDMQLSIMKPGQDLFYVTTAVLTKMKEVINQTKPSLVLVQGDTTTALAASLAAFYSKIPVGHIEAGLRTGNIYAPFPEEMNRKLISSLATFNFAPTQLSVDNLRAEGVKESTIYMVGNTVVDALLHIQNDLLYKKRAIKESLADVVAHAKKENKDILLLTVHRRESFDSGLGSIFRAIKNIMQNNRNLLVIYPMHPNPCIQNVFKQQNMEVCENLYTCDPVDYATMVYLLNAVDIVATDSGGIQEEAASLGKRVFILRNETDRPEAIQCGCAQLIGTDQLNIERALSCALHNNLSNGTKVMPYGDGHAAQAIVDIVMQFGNH